jgi:predicted transcriptional regulator
MMETSSGTVSAHLDGNVLAMLKKIAADEDRSVSWLVGFAVKQLIADRVEKQQPFRDGAAKHRQVDLETAIADAVKRGPSRPAKHK